ncbi:DNA polymerase epsilon subunit 4 [Ochlerotatus camptorhynchus]|uniref:DNA polymerase epsilon subunit 4 n=1 Tax=Ochlerotatus camptorhynchus TaxID=644619 RepID=UPI0031CEDFA0
METTEDYQTVEKSGEIPGFIDSEEIDFGTEPSSDQVNQVHTEELLHGDQDAEEEVIEPTVPVALDIQEELAAEETPDLDENHEESAQVSEASSKGPRLVQFPLSKIKQIMKFDPDVQVISGQAIFLVTRAAELFVQTMAKEFYTHTVAGKKKTISKRDVDLTIQSVDTLMFLEGMMNVQPS